MKIKKLILASPRGFCAGVERAVSTVEECLTKFGAPIFVNHEIVHNKFIVQNFEKKGVIFTDNLEKIPNNSVYIFSAHGVNPEFRKEVKKKGLRVIDATCPLVQKVHSEAENFAKNGFEIFYIGKANHQEFLGISGIAEIHLIENVEDAENIDIKSFAKKRVVALSQTTLSQKDTSDIFEILRGKFDEIMIPGDICYATQNRQNAIKVLAEKSDAVIVIGSQNSSNSNKLVEVAGKSCPAILCEDFTEISEDFLNKEVVGISSGASVPEILVKQVINFFKEKNPEIVINTINISQESVKFPLPQI